MKPKSKPRFAVFIVLVVFLTAVTSDLESDRQALIALRSAVHGRTRQWNVTASPCTWEGVRCQSGRVTELHLPGRGLVGQLPPAIGNLTQLRAISFRLNGLTGPIPADFANLSLLRGLYLQGNRFSGEIPALIFGLPNLSRLDLSKNNFSGPIPENVNEASKLTFLYLQENQLTGTIANLTLPLQKFNVSYNQLNGSIPNQLSGQPESAFAGNSLCGKPLNPCEGETPVNQKKSDGLSGGAIAGIIIAGVVGLFLILLILFLLCRKRNKKETLESRNAVSELTATSATSRATISDAPPARSTERENRGSSVSKERKSGPVSKELVFFVDSLGKFDLDGLLKASAEVLGKGTFGSSYKASFDYGLVVAVKRLRDIVGSEKEFRDRIESIGSMSHENLVRLIGYYYNRDEKLLVYEFMPKGSLSALLHANKGSSRTPLSWETRVGIAQGAARGIMYIHARDTTSSHGNIKSSNILLSDSFQAKVSDFRLAPLASPTAAPNRIDGYRAPEVTDSRNISHKADVYSFGVLLLELLTGKSPTQQQLNGEGVDLPRWVQSVVEQQSPSDAFDPELLRYESNGNEGMIRLLKLALNCTAQHPDNRPSMAETARAIDEIPRFSGSPSPLSE